jgi:hypothetical protein
VGKTGELDMHGKEFVTWSRLDASIKLGTNVIRVQDPVDWRPGQLIVIASTIWRDEAENQNEVHRVLSVKPDKRTIILASNLRYYHFGHVPGFLLCNSCLHATCHKEG